MSNLNSKPWEFNNELTENRLITMASFIAMVRAEVIELHDEDLGDTRLALGMRAYECCRSRIISEAESGSFPWLGIATPEGRFTFTIANIPVRFSRNDPKYLPDQKLVVSTETYQQMQMFGSTSAYANVRWFFIFDTHFKKAADCVFFIGYTETGEIVCQWEVPIEDAVTLLSEVDASKPQAVELPKPTVKLRLVKENVKSDENDK